MVLRSGQALGKRHQIILFFKGIQSGDGLLGILLHKLAALVQAVEPDEGVFLRVHAGSLAQLCLGADDVQHVVPNLEGQTQQRRKPGGGLLLASVPSPAITPRTQGAVISLPVFRLWISSTSCFVHFRSSLMISSTWPPIMPKDPAHSLKTPMASPIFPGSGSSVRVATAKASVRSASPANTAIPSP